MAAMDEQAFTSVPKRRWPQFSLRFLLLGITVIACLLVWAPWKRDPDEWIVIAEVGDLHPTIELLEQNGIECGCEGSLRYEIFVQRRHAPRACILIRNAGLEGGPFQNQVADY